MLQKSKFFILIGVLMLLLAACGTSTNQENSKDTNKNTEQTSDTTNQPKESELGEQNTNDETETETMISKQPLIKMNK